MNTLTIRARFDRDKKNEIQVSKISIETNGMADKTDIQLKMLKSAKDQIDANIAALKKAKEESDKENVTEAGEKVAGSGEKTKAKEEGDKSESSGKEAPKAKASKSTSDTSKAK